MKKLILFSLVSFPLFAAPVGEDVKAGGQDATCRILYRNLEGKLSSICSGILVSSTKVLTAGHCLRTEPELKASVECGYVGTVGEEKIEKTGGGSQVVTSTKFKEVRTDVVAKSKPDMIPDDVSKDVAVIVLKKPITTIKPIPYAKNGLGDFFTSTDLVTMLSGISNNTFDPKKPRLTLREGAECKTEGFGINNQGFSGKLFSGPVTQGFENRNNTLSMSEVSYLDIEGDDLNNFKKCLSDYGQEILPKNFIPIAKIVHQFAILKSTITAGDSGGPIYCRVNNNSPWQVVGISSKNGFGLNEESLVPAFGSINYWHTVSDDDWKNLVEK
jgi:hypothetical protein